MTKSDPFNAFETTFSEGSLFRVSTSIYNESGATASESRSYYDIPTSGVGGEGTHYDATEFLYDAMGRRVGSRDATETITRTIYDSIGRASVSYIGTNDNDSGTFSEFLSTTGTSDMVKVSETEYDSGNAAGNSLVTKTTAFVEDGTTDKREATFKYDTRGRRIVSLGAQAPYTLVKLDNLGRTTAVGQYTSSTGLDATDDPTSLATNRTALSKSNYDELGRVWKSQRYKIIQSTGATGVTIDSESWWDAEGRLVKQQGNQLTKTAYDRIGRATHQYVLAYTDDTAYADADDVTGDIVVEQTQTVYNTSDQVEMRVAISREHDDYGTGETTGGLDSNADNDDLLVTATNLSGRVSINATWYDNLGRTTTSAVYGTNGGSNFDRDGLTAPTATTGIDAALVSTVTYNDNGTQQKTTNADTIATRYEYDDAGRQVAVIANDTGAATPLADMTRDNDHYTRTVYTNGQRTKLWVDLDGDGTEDADDQVTIYIYGVTKGTGAGDSKISSNALLRAVVYPDSTNTGTTSANIDSDDSDVVSYAYNAQSQQISMKDQAGNITDTSYDTAGRITARAVTTLATGFDGAVRRIETGYNTRGFVDTVTQYDAAAAGSVVDEVKYDYDDWGPISKITQDHDSAVATGGTQYTVEYSYTKQAKSGARRALILDNFTLPDGTVVDYVSTNIVGSAGGDGKLGRVSSVKVGVVTVAAYDYLGLGRLVRTDLPEPDYFKTLSGSTNYDRLDRFGRITNDIWTADLGTDRDLAAFNIAYDDLGNITKVDDAQRVIHDWKYAIDDLNRLTDADRGTLNGEPLSTTNSVEDWNLSQTGNWLLHQADLNNDAAYTGLGEEDGDNDGAGFFNNANEWLTRDTDGDGTADITMSYDEVGNMTDDGEDYTYVYDPFGRLRKVENRANAALVAEYRYNGLNQRITTHFDTDADKDVDGNDITSHFVYDGRWRMAARYEDANTDPTEQWVYHHAGLAESGGSSYIDSVILRDRDTSASGTLDERVYYLQNWRQDVVALIKDNGDQIEQIRYEPYGSPFGLPASDTDGDGDVDQADVDQVTSWYNASTYDSRGDLNMDGAVNLTDITLATAAKVNGDTLGLYSLSLVDNRKGYAGYEDLSELTDAKWDVRNRVLNSKLGRILNNSGVKQEFLGYNTSWLGSVAKRPWWWDEWRNYWPIDPDAPSGLPDQQYRRWLNSPCKPSHIIDDKGKWHVVNTHCASYCARHRNNGGVVECSTYNPNGRKTHCCICTKNFNTTFDLEDNHLNDPTGAVILILLSHCILSHEEYHWFQHGCGTPKHEAECPAYRAQLNCLIASRILCDQLGLDADGVIRCKHHVDKAIKNAQDGIENNCGVTEPPDDVEPVPGQEYGNNDSP